MPTRSYVSPVRNAVAAEKRARVVAVAGRLLSEEANVASFSLEAVAKTAGVTRLTVYNQFGSRRGLLEAVFDERAKLGGLSRILEAAAMDDPRAGLDRLIEIFCEFWGDSAIARLHAAAAADPEFAQAMAERNERRRRVLGGFVARICGAEPAGARSRKDAVDLMFAVTSHAMFATMSVGRSREAVCALLKSACAAALERVGT